MSTLNISSEFLDLVFRSWDLFHWIRAEISCRRLVSMWQTAACVSKIMLFVLEMLGLGTYSIRFAPKCHAESRSRCGKP